MALLDGVSQLMGEKVLPIARARLILVAREEDVVLVGEGARGKLVAQARRFHVLMDAHIAEIGVEARLHVAAHV